MPIRFAQLGGFRQEIGKLARVEASLSLGARLE
jgi:hypothetical protein